MGDPISLGAVFASISSAFKFADLAIRVAEVGSENEVFVRTIRVVRDDLNEVERLLNVESVQRKLTSIPGKLPWVRGAVLNTKAALNEIGKWVERARSEHESTGEIRFETRVRWVFNDHEKIMNRKSELTTCHQQLSNVLNYINRLEDVPTSLEPPQYIDSTFFDELLSRHRRPTGARLALPDLKPSRSTSDLASVPYIASNTSRPDISRNDYAVNLDPTVDGPVRIQITALADSPPHSPPPTYNSIVRPNASSNVAHHNLLETMVPQSHYPNDGKKPITQSESTEDQSTKSRSWAYILPSPEGRTPELAGDAVTMSANNSLGPVNPFELAAIPIRRENAVPPKQHNIKALGELLGDLTFPAELPASIPGPPPGYPRRVSERPISTHGNDDTSLQAQRQPHRQSMPEVPAIRRRPIPLHSQSQPEIPHHTDAQSILTWPTLSTYPSEKLLAITEQHIGCQELPTRTQTRKDPRPPHTSQLSPQHQPSELARSCTPRRYRRRSDQPGHITSEAYPPKENVLTKRTSSPLPASTHDQRYPAPFTSRPPSAQSLPMPVDSYMSSIAPSVPPRPSSAIPPPLLLKTFETASIARRQRQRDMMDLLGSLET